MTFLFCIAPIAQLVEQWSYKPYVVGSSPAGSIDVYFCDILLKNVYSKTNVRGTEIKEVSNTYPLSRWLVKHSISDELL